MKLLFNQSARNTIYSIACAAFAPLHHYNMNWPGIKSHVVLISRNENEKVEEEEDDYMDVATQLASLESMEQAPAPTIPLLNIRIK